LGQPVRSAQRRSAAGNTLSYLRARLNADGIPLKMLQGFEKIRPEILKGRRPISPRIAKHPTRSPPPSPNRDGRLRVGCLPSEFVLCAVEYESTIEASNHVLVNQGYPV
jgi:hypothetical protein